MWPVVRRPSGLTVIVTDLPGMILAGTVGLCGDE